MKVLFIGNSHTFVHYVPARVKTFCESHDHPIEPVMLTHPGIGLDWHLGQSQTTLTSSAAVMTLLFYNTTPIRFPEKIPCWKPVRKWLRWCRKVQKFTCT